MTGERQQKTETLGIYCLPLKKVVALDQLRWNWVLSHFACLACGRVCCPGFVAMFSLDVTVSTPLDDVTVVHFVLTV